MSLQSVCTKLFRWFHSYIGVSLRAGCTHSQGVKERTHSVGVELDFIPHVFAGYIMIISFICRTKHTCGLKCVCPQFVEFEYFMSCRSGLVCETPKRRSQVHGRSRGSESSMRDFSFARRFGPARHFLRRHVLCRHFLLRHFLRRPCLRLYGACIAPRPPHCRTSSPRPGFSSTA